MNELSKKIRPIYSELKGYAAVPIEESIIFDDLAQTLCSQLNKTIDELTLVSKYDYAKFKINPSSIQWNGISRIHIRTLDYQNKLSGLISRIQGEFFAEEQVVLNTPNTVIHASQNQIQQQQQSIAVDLAMTIAEKRNEYKKGTPERNFMDQISEALKTVGNVKEIIQQIISIAMSTGVGIEFLKKVFGM